MNIKKFFALILSVCLVFSFMAIVPCAASDGQEGTSSYGDTEDTSDLYQRSADGLSAPVVISESIPEEISGALYEDAYVTADEPAEILDPCEIQPDPAPEDDSPAEMKIQSEPRISAAEDASGSSYVLTAVGIDDAASEVSFAVWTETNGQDDLRWIAASKNGDEWETVCPANGFYHSGTALIHCYQTIGGKKVFAGGTEAEVTSDRNFECLLSEDEKQISVTASGIRDDADSVRIAVWSEAGGQDDLRWENAVKSGPQWKVQLPVNGIRHTGRVLIHCYQSASGALSFFDGTNITLLQPSGSVSVTDVNSEAGTFKACIGGISSPSGIKEVSFGVWGDSGGQNDLVWHKAVQDGDSFTSDISASAHKYESGKYQIHCYITDGNGLKSFAGAAEADLALSNGTASAVSDPDTGDFRIDLSGASNLPSGTQIRMAVWNDSDFGSLKWYPAQKKNGTYTASGNISAHKYLTGKYTVHIYADIPSSDTRFICGTNMSFEISHEGIIIGPGEDNTIYPLTVKQLHFPGHNGSVKAAVWSSAGGQDDLVWYPMKADGRGDFTAEIDIRNHKHEGRYYIHVYAQSRSGSWQFAGADDSLNVQINTKGSLAAEGTDASQVAFDLSLQISGTDTPIRSVRIAAWSRNDQSDLYWYTAEKQDESGNVWSIPIDVSNHRGNFGLYTIHAYAKYKNGLTKFVTGTTREISTDKLILLVSGTGRNAERNITLKNAPSHLKDLRFAIWSETDGQDDLVWYSAKNDGSGNNAVTINARDHKNSGRFIAHVYSGSTFVAGTSFDISYDEVKTSWSELASRLSAGKTTDQLILVSASGTSAKVSMLNKNADGSWFTLFETDGFVGRGGVGETTEWNGRTPSGVYGFTVAFGVKADPGCSAFPYTRVDSSYYWVDDVNSPYYNKFVTTKNTPMNWSSAEHLIDYTVSYAYSIAIDYNPECIPGVGSAIFLHCSQNRPTGGCVAVPEAIMIRILQNMKPGCKIIIANASDLSKY